MRWIHQLLGIGKFAERGSSPLKGVHVGGGDMATHCKAYGDGERTEGNLWQGEHPYKDSRTSSDQPLGDSDKVPDEATGGSME